MNLRLITVFDSKSENCAGFLLKFCPERGTRKARPEHNGFIMRKILEFEAIESAEIYDQSARKRDFLKRSYRNFIGIPLHLPL